MNHKIEIKPCFIMTKDQEIGKTILRRIFMNGSVTRPEIVRITGCRAATVLYAIDLLKKQGIICEPERTGKKTGRKAPALSFTPDCRCFAGIDFQESRTLAVFTDMTGKILFQTETQAGDRKTLAGCRQEIRETLCRLKQLAGPWWEKLGGIGFADPGLVDIPRGFSIRAVNVPGWVEAATGEWLTREFGVVSGVWPECMVKTFMECQIRHFPSNQSLFHLALGSGIGGGFIKNGECFTGDTNQAMEIGHIVIDPNGPLCRCGNRGCLEAVAGETEIIRRVQEALNNGVETALQMQNFTLERFAQYARTDKAARIIAVDVCEKIGKALSVAVTLLNPSLIVLSGSLTAMGDLLTDSIRNILKLNCFPGAVRHLRLEISKAPPEAAAAGATQMMRGKYLGLL